MTLWHSLAIPLYTTCWIRRSNELDYRLVMPPVAEQHGDYLAVVDGVHRLYGAWMQQTKSVSVIVVRGDLPKPASPPVRWNELREYDKRKRYVSRRDKFRQLRLDEFRPVGSYLRSKRFTFESLRQLRELALSEAAHAGEIPSLFWCREHEELDECATRGA